MRERIGRRTVATDWWTQSLRPASFIFGADSGLTETANDLGFWNDIVVGLITLVIGADSAYEVRDHRETVREAAT